MVRGYGVGPPMSLEALTNSSDIIFKGTVVSNKTESDTFAFPSIMGFATHETDFKVISIIKGQNGEIPLRFLNYERDSGLGMAPYEREYYHFEPGRTYIVFAKRSRNPQFFQQISMFQSPKEAEGVLLCANDNALPSSSIKDIFWLELTALLKSTDGNDVVYAIDQLDEMSGGGSRLTGVSDFDRKSVLGTVHKFVADRDPNVAQEAIGVIGSHNPFMSEGEGREASWLVTVGSAKLPGFAPMQRTENIGGKLYWKDLVSIANSKADATTRALAISALGLTREPSLRPYVLQWLPDRSPAVRSSATVLLADFSTLATHDRIAILARDTSASVRTAAAREIGFAQQVTASDVAAKLITDPDAGVRKMAAMSLLTFSPDNNEVAKIFRANLDNREFEPLFLIALASNNAGPYLDALAKAIEEKPTPTNGWGGNTDLAAWEVLFKYLEGQPLDEIRSGKFNRYLDAMEKVGNYSSSYPRDIYAFYVQRGMTDRAKAFRSKADKAVTYDLDQYFRQVDQQFRKVEASPSP
ncbi:MAG: HEAT repeat domain-containing protein [Vulcanimicrobiaceae bacterium]